MVVMRSKQAGEREMKERRGKERRSLVRAPSPPPSLPLLRLFNYARSWRHTTNQNDWLLDRAARIEHHLLGIVRDKRRCDIESSGLLSL